MIRPKAVDDRIKDILYGMKSEVGVIYSDVYFLIDVIQKYEEWIEYKDEALEAILDNNVIHRTEAEMGIKALDLTDKIK